MKRSQPETGGSSNQPKRNKGSNHNKNSTRGTKKNKKQKEIIRTGKIGSFLNKEWSDELLLGNLSTVSTDDAVLANLDCIARFLADYRAMSTLHVQAQQASTSTSISTSTSSQNEGHITQQVNNNDNTSPLQPRRYTAYYIPTIGNFARTQIDRQSAGLRTNTTSQTTDGMTKVVNAHTQALEAAMAHVDPFQATRFVHDRNRASSQRHSEGADGNDHDDNTTDHLIPSKQSLSEWHGILYSYASPNQQQASQASKSQDNTTSAAARRPPPTPFRTGGARAGSTHFCPPSEIAEEFQRFRTGIVDICCQWEERILSMPERRVSTGTRTASSTSTSRSGSANPNRLSPQQKSIYYSVGATAMLLYGIVDIHMFSDGNGRLARIGANWMLKRTLGLPFTIAIAANPQQRREYIEALQKARAAVKQALEHHQKKQQSKPNAKRAAIPKTGIFEPLVRLILDRMANAVRECQRNLEEKSRASMVEEEDRLARRARERLASGACVICLDDNPNIATLCCGQGVHLNCFAEWLANNPTCVYCRKPFQSLQVQRPPPPPQGAAAAAVAPNAGQHNQQQQNAETTTDDTTSFETTTDDNDESEMVTQDQDSTTQDSDESETTTHDTTTHETTTNDIDEDETSAGETTTFPTHDNDETETTTNDDVDETETTTHDVDETSTHDTTTNDVDEDETSTNDTTTDDTTVHGTSTQDTSVDENATENTTEETTDDTSDDITTSHVQQRSERCGRCNNKAAVDCVNHMCGRCCVLVGEYHCHRHSTS
mmetsp:Transcript_29952/g.71948  ORF Transcript_29952/g.71948 Transcript_29952/m.71948 type:complete len:773 (-) Transcript_29952:1155-3473(-)